MIVFDAEKQRQAIIMQLRAWERANKNKPEHNKGELNSKDFESITGTVTREQLK